MPNLEYGKWDHTKIDGIYSRDLLQQQEGTVKLVMLEQGAAYPRHQHPNRTEYAYVLEGQPTLTVGDEESLHKDGDFVIFPTNVPHALANKSDRRTVLLIGAIIQPAPEEAESVKQRTRQDNLRNIIRELIQEEFETFYAKMGNLLSER